MTSSDTRALLVTGLPRSGTSWVGKMLEASGEVVYVNEPLNPGHPPGRSPGVLDAEVSHQFQYICRDNEADWLPAFQRTVQLRYGVRAELRRNRSAYDLARMAKYVSAFRLGQARHRRALLDDPFAVLSAAWFAERLQCRTVILVREPTAFVGSWKRLGWAMHFHELLEQPLLVRDHLHPYTDRMRAMVGSSDHLARTCLLWEMTYAIAAGIAEQYDAVRLVRYEDLVASPLAAFEDLYRHMGVTWTPAARDSIRRATTAAATGEGGSHAWSFRGGVSRTAYRPMDSRQAMRGAGRRLSPEDTERVLDLTGATAQLMGYVRDAR